MRGRLVLGAAARGAPRRAGDRPDLPVLLLLPFMAYGVVLLGLNLLFGYTGLVSFGHALFIGIGAYAGAVLTGPLGIRHFEVTLPVAALAGGLVAALVGLLCVRYVKIYFGMLTLAFGMVFYTFLLKFYRLTGGDEGMPVLRPFLLGQDFATLGKTAYLDRPVLLLLARAPGPRRLRHVAHRAVALRSLPAHHPRQSPQGGGARRERHALPLVRLRHLRRLRRGGRRPARPRRRATWTRRSPTGPTPATSCS